MLFEPILGPFGEELDRLAETFNNFAKTEDFATLRDAFANIAIDGAKYIGDLVASFNFADAKAACCDSSQTQSKPTGN